MKTSKELKQEARMILQGRWGKAVLLNVIPSLIIIGFSLIFIVPVVVSQVITAMSMNNGYYAYTAAAGSSNYSTVSSFFSIVVGALFTSGISWTYLDLIRGSRSEISPLKDALRAFNGKTLVTVAILAVLVNLFSGLWGLLLIIPGIVKSYSYSQSYYIYYDSTLNEKEGLSALDTITASRKMMDGYKGKLFLLDLSFIGWHILSIATLGLGYLWLSPYIQVTKSAFYENLAKND
ncbi:DUF975 family protein [Enterococcus sp. AZ007]|uniref:DUF975 family protein n=1 Tax=Enterococcus sp. AZ007 TaxID=2774839 RepID=UPI003F24B78B